MLGISPFILKARFALIIRWYLLLIRLAKLWAYLTNTRVFTNVFMITKGFLQG